MEPRDSLLRAGAGGANHGLDLYYDLLDLCAGQILHSFLIFFLSRNVVKLMRLFVTALLIWYQPRFNSKSIFSIQFSIPKMPSMLSIYSGLLPLIWHTNKLSHSSSSSLNLLSFPLVLVLELLRVVVIVYRIQVVIQFIGVEAWCLVCY